MDETESVVKEVDSKVLPKGARAAIVARLPKEWSQPEIDHFINTYYEVLPEELVATATEEEEGEFQEITGEPTQAYAETLAIAPRSRKGYTLDSYIIVDGRSVTLRAIYEAGQLLPIRSIIQSGRRMPVSQVLYQARIIDRPRILDITEETYKALSERYPQTVPHDEPLSAEGVARVQSRPSVVKPDKLERTFVRDRPKRTVTSRP